MPAPPPDERVDRPAEPWRVKARQWHRAALAMAFLFGSLPLAGRLFLGSWEFDGAAEIACLCLAVAAYLYLAGRARRVTLPDSATMLDRAIQLAAAGDAPGGIALLDEALRLSPRLWQARQYRGQIRLVEGAAAEAALRDFTEAIRLAPREAHLYLLRSHVLTLLGRETAARADRETAALLQEVPEDPRGGD